jgi:Protein kinase domain
VTGRCWLIGFGIASRLPRERQSVEPPELVAGTLAYMAPEQTGRMNRSIDSRSDLYSLGVTLYEVLTGTLPFTASDPMEWVHCHIARQPVSPSERFRDVPGSVSAVVMKLLAKTAEERYQTAAGVETDFQRRFVEWETHRRVDEFALGQYDISDRPLIPGKLYGRAREIEAVRLELIMRLESSYRFVHDRVQEAAYSLIPEELRAEAHLQIGRQLVAYTPLERREEAIFEIVNQLNRGAVLIDSRDELEQLAEFNLMAGKRAKAAAAYNSALKYFIAGAAL